MPLKNHAPQSDRGYFYFIDDFVGGGLDARVWSVGGTAGGSVAKLAALAGQVRITIGAIATNEYYLEQSTSRNYDLTRFVDLSWLAKIENLSNVATQFGFYGDASNSIQIVYDSTVNANWLAKTKAGVNTTTITSSVAVDTGWHRLRITGSAASMDFFVDAALLASITTNIPTSNAGLRAYGYRNAGGSGTRSFLVDWCEAVGARA